MFIWNSSYEINIALVDTQHRRLIDLINDLETAIGGADVDAVRHVIDELTAYTVYHFGQEESLMVERGYPADLTAAHKSEHRKFIDKINELRERYDVLDIALADSLHLFLSQWLVTHILVADKAYATFFASGALPEPPEDNAVNDVKTLRRQLELSNAEKSLLSALRDSEKRFRVLTDNTPVLVWMSDERGKRAYFNRRSIDFVGSSQHGRAAGDWGAALHPEDAAAYTTFHSGLQADPTAAAAEFRLRRADGIFRWMVEQVAPLFDDSDACIGFIGSCLDITERKEAEYLLAHTNEELERLVNERTSALQTANAELTRNEAVIRQLMLTDPLTDIANRRCLNERLEQEFERYRRYHQPLSVIIADIDHFKSVNDTFGHEIGDLVLKSFAATVKGALRIQDLLGRFGGEEFLMILPSTTLAEAREVAERVRETIVAMALAQIPKGVTASFGVATATPFDARDDMVKRADQALYASKRNGRNRVTVADDAEALAAADA